MTATLQWTVISVPVSDDVCVQLQAHLDSTQRQQRTEQDLNMAIQSKAAQLEEEQRRWVGSQAINKTCTFWCKQWLSGC